MQPDEASSAGAPAAAIPSSRPRPDILATASLMGQLWRPAPERYRFARHRRHIVALEQQSPNLDFWLENQLGRPGHCFRLNELSKAESAHVKVDAQ